MSSIKESPMAREVMSTRITYIDGLATVREAVNMMRHEKVEALIVEKRSPQDAYGIVVIQDIITGVFIPDRSPDDVNVYEIMTKPVVSVPADMRVRYAARLLSKFGLKIAPVEDQGAYIGMLSLSSIILSDIV